MADVEEDSTTGDSHSAWSAFTLVAVNLFTIPVALLLKWQAGEILLVYLLQSVIAGAVAMVRAAGIMRARQPPLGEDEDRAESQHVMGCVIFFAFPHLMLAAAVFTQDLVYDAALAIVMLAFLVQCVLDLRRDRQRDAVDGLPDPMKVLHIALARVVPAVLMAMIATTNIMGSTQRELICLLCIKTLADTALHYAGFADARSGPDEPDFTIGDFEVYLPFNLTVGLTIIAVAAVGGTFLHLYR
jgi:Family of unknown function (DUF6498)